MVPLQRSASLHHAALVLQKPKTAHTSCRWGSARCIPHLYPTSIWEGAAAYSLCGSTGPGLQGSHTAHHWLRGGASPQQEDAVSRINSNLGLRRLLLSVATTVDLDQFTVFQSNQTPAYVGRETDISFSPVSLRLQLFPFTKCWSSACVDGRLFHTPPPQDGVFSTGHSSLLWGLAYGTFLVL